MKRILMLEPTQCGSCDFLKGKVYNVTADKLINSDIDCGVETEEEFDNEKWLNSDLERYITVLDESNDEDCFQVGEPDDRFIIFENNKQFANYLLNNINGIDEAIVNLYMSMANM